MTTQTASTPVFAVQRSGERAYFDHGWLKTYHSFSFAEYRDPDNLNWGALRVFNDDVVAGGSGFPPHPHRDMEIVTYVLSGELAHRDSMGNHGVVGSGDVQFMSAGTGVTHSEFNNRADEPLHLVQMWVLPGKLGQPPAYGQMEFATGDRLNRWFPLVSGEQRVQAPIRITQHATLSVARLEDVALVYDFAPARYGFLFLAGGSVTANGEQLQTGDAVRLYDVAQLRTEGSGELVLWDLPEVALA
jgi:redox-sensitive bicupin YhaK (pirin superfamily)